MTDQFAPGWYPDPAGTPRLRYFDGHTWTEQYAALIPAAWPPPSAPGTPIKQPARAGWKRKRVLIPAAVIGLLAINAVNTPRSSRVATSPSTTIATQVLADAVTVTAAATTSTAAPASTTTTTATVAPTTVANTIPPTTATTTPTTTPAKTAPMQVLPIAAPAGTELPAAEPPAADPSTAPPTVRVPATTAQAATVYYRTCAEARAAGVTPLRRGDPGYAAHLDKDNDGIACE
jgi:Excalibur calcium-binding domain/Protein of unknown function (DUF2510)